MFSFAYSHLQTTTSIDMKNLLIFLSLFTSFELYAQEKTIYYDANRNEISDKSKAVYYRKVVRDAHMPTLFLAKDYWITGELLMDAELSSVEPQVKNGAIKYFFKNGKKKSEGKMQNDRLIGECSYYYANGVLRASGPYTNGKKNGVWKTFNTEGVQYLKQTFENDVLTGIELLNKAKGFYEYYSEEDSTVRYTLVPSVSYKTAEEYKLTEPLIKDNFKFLETCINQSVFQPDYQYTLIWLTNCPYAGKMTVNLSHFMKDYTTDLERSYDYYPQMTKMYMIGLGKYLLEHNGKVESPAEYHASGANSMVNYFLTLKKSDPKAKSKKMDELADLQKKGKLLSYIQNYQ
jgi:hypothetical protein